MPCPRASSAAEGPVSAPRVTIPSGFFRWDQESSAPDGAHSFSWIQLVEKGSEGGQEWRERAESISEMPLWNAEFHPCSIVEARERFR
jgi:hypothetical protein